MKISKYGITLSLLRQQDIEFVSQKFYPKEENLSDEFSESIAGNVQEWIDSIYSFKNFYYIIEYKGVKIGMINDKVLDWKGRTSETELILWDDSYSDSIVPMLATLCLLETGFYYLGWKSYKTLISKSDLKGIKNATSLGFILSDNQHKQQDQEYLLSKESFEINASKALLEASKHIDETSDEGYLLLEPFDYESGVAQKIESHITDSGIYLHRKGKAGSRMYFR